MTPPAARPSHSTLPWRGSMVLLVALGLLLLLVASLVLYQHQATELRLLRQVNQLGEIERRSLATELATEQLLVQNERASRRAGLESVGELQLSLLHAPASTPSVPAGAVAWRFRTAGAVLRLTDSFMATHAPGEYTLLVNGAAAAPLVTLPGHGAFTVHLPQPLTGPVQWELRAGGGAVVLRGETP